MCFKTTRDSRGKLNNGLLLLACRHLWLEVDTIESDRGQKRERRQGRKEKKGGMDGTKRQREEKLRQKERQHTWRLEAGMQHQGAATVSGEVFYTLGSDEWDCCKGGQ